MIIEAAIAAVAAVVAPAAVETAAVETAVVETAAVAAVERQVYVIQNVTSLTKKINTIILFWLIEEMVF